ncbi:MAG: 2-desacetyl-2-hydroxyethyl bacteriochlorophyllide A dehydrogenase [Hyphomicrobiaceae bacterium]|jgi:2-desacetyl-2-hydroxyethyl bacteriochlorophyllide A dehydrogenase
MLAAALTTTRKVELRETATPTPGSGEVLVRVSLCGICGSDLHVFRRGDGAESRGVCPGHEISGEIEAVGANVNSVREGDRVAIEPLRTCGTCAACKRGDYHLCPRLELLGVSLPGGMADSVIAPAGSIYQLPQSVDLEIGALAEPTAVAVHAARLGGVGPGSSVLVLGSGTIGLLAAAAARHLGAEYVAATARHDHQRALAEAMGCDDVLTAEDFRKTPVRPDVVIETVGGGATTVGDAVMAVQRGGTVVIVGLFDETPAFDPMAMLIKEVRMIGAMVYNRRDGRSDFDIALELLSERGDVLRQLITHSFPLSEAQKGFETAEDKKSGAVKVLLAPGV